MKKYFLITICLVSIVGVVWSAGQGTVSAKGSQAVKASKTKAPSQALTFNGKKFYLQYSVGNKQEWLNEYLPSGQNFDNYTEMVALRSYDSIKATPMQIAQAIASNYRRDYPGIKFLLAANEKTGDGVVSYIMVDKNILEHNLFRTTMKDNIPVSIQYVYRQYFPKGYQNEDLSSFGQKVKQRRNEWINALDQMSVPSMIRTIKQ